jgi:hypothetical protein
VRTFWRAAPPNLHPVRSFEHFNAQMNLELTVNSWLGNVKKSCKYEIYALK